MKKAKVEKADVGGLERKIYRLADTERCSESVLKEASDLLDTELGSVMLVDEKNNELLIKKAFGLDENITRSVRIKIGQGISGWVAKTGQPLLIKNLSKDKRFNVFKKKDSGKYTTDSLLSVPLKIGNKVIGVINVNNKKTKKPFTKYDLKILSFVAEQAGLAMQNAFIYEDTKRLADMKLDFISNVSHELKNPLAIIRESISYMHDSLNGKSDKKNIEILGIAVNNIDRLNRLLDSLLDLAKFEAGKAVIKRSYIDLKNLISECVDFIRSNAEAKGIKINTDFFVRYSKIWADEDKITQVVNNLLNNAIKFTPKDGAVNITVKEDDGKILLSVQDSGIGIKKEDIPKLFNRFERITSPQLKTEGTGLGLAICKEIVDIHKGKIWAESASPKGTKFNIMLPKDLRREERYSS